MPWGSSNVGRYKYRIESSVTGTESRRRRMIGGIGDDGDHPRLHISHQTKEHEVVGEWFDRVNRLM